MKKVKISISILSEGLFDYFSSVLCNSKTAQRTFGLPVPRVSCGNCVLLWGTRKHFQIKKKSIQDEQQQHIIISSKKRGQNADAACKNPPSPTMTWTTAFVFLFDIISTVTFSHVAVEEFWLISFHNVVPVHWGVQACFCAKHPKGPLRSPHCIWISLRSELWLSHRNTLIPSLFNNSVVDLLVCLKSPRCMNWFQPFDFRILW